MGHQTSNLHWALPPGIRCRLRAIHRYTTAAMCEIPGTSNKRPRMPQPRPESMSRRAIATCPDEMTPLLSTHCTAV